MIINWTEINKVTDIHTRRFSFFHSDKQGNKNGFFRAYWYHRKSKETFILHIFYCFEGDFHKESQIVNKEFKYSDFPWVNNWDNEHIKIEMLNCYKDELERFSWIFKDFLKQTFTQKSEGTIIGQ